MAKIIKITPEHIEQAKREFNDFLNTAKLSDGKINFSKNIDKIDRKANLRFTEIAWLKMQTLIREFSKEVAWHGIAYRNEDPEKDEYIITDILVYPQEVSGATVTTDQSKYETWLMSHEDDVFNNIRMQGHSHVNMGVTPSGVDLTLYEDILDKLEDDMFYIFLIWNKKEDRTVKIYDMKKNVLFETADVVVSIIDDGTGIESFLANAKTMVVEKVYNSPQSQTPYKYPQTQLSGSENSKKNSSEKTKKNDEPEKGKRDGNWRTGKTSSYASDDYDDFYERYGGYPYR